MMKKKKTQPQVPPLKQIAACSSEHESLLYGLDKHGRVWSLEKNGYWYPVETRLAPDTGEER